MSKRDPEKVAAEITKLFALKTVDLYVVRTDFYGRGSTASVDVHVSDGSTIDFPSVRDIGNPTRLALEVAACTGGDSRPQGTGGDPRSVTAP